MSAVSASQTRGAVHRATSSAGSAGSADEATRIPPWAAQPRAGQGTYEEILSADLMSRLRDVADRLDVPLHALFVAAHAKVLAALTGDQVVWSGYDSGDRSGCVSRRFDVFPGSWRDLIHGVARQLAGTPVTGRSVPRGAAEASDAPWCDTVVSPHGDAGRLAAGTTLRVGVRHTEAGSVLRLRYDTRFVDTAYASRIAGYHVSALRDMTEAVEAAHHRHCLLTPAEVRAQIDALEGNRREVPDRRIHEIFEEMASLYPDRVAVVHQGREWTYAQLDDRADALARRLLAHGLASQERVAVVTG